MANPELGGKQICPTCSSKFYDLNRRPALCPKCGAEFDPEEALRNRRVRIRPLATEDDGEADAPKTEVVADADAEDETEDAPELDAVVDEPPLHTDDDDDADDTDAAPGGPAESLGVDFAEDDDVEASDDDDGVPFIEDEDDDFPEDEIDGLPAEGGPEDH